MRGEPSETRSVYPDEPIVCRPFTVIGNITETLLTGEIDLEKGAIEIPRD